MLRHLRVTNFAILSDVAIEFEGGMNALTGETGAGKSLIVEAVNLLRGGRASADIPRAGAKEAVVEAIFDIPADLTARIGALLADAGVPASDGEVLVRRVIQRGGRSRTYVNGALTTARRLAEIGALLVDLSGQHQHQGLVDPRRHREILDALSAEPALTDAMAAAHDRLRAAEAAIRALEGDAGALAERIDYLRFQLDELDAAALSPDEDAELARERDRLRSLDKLVSAAGEAHELVYDGDDAAIDRISAAIWTLERVASLDSALAERAARLSEIRTLVEDVASELRSYADGLEGDPDRLVEVEDRLALVQRLIRKHGGRRADDAGDPIGAVLARADALRAELDGLEHRDQRLAERERERAAADAAAADAAAALTRSRRRAADVLTRDVGAALAELSMEGAALTVDIEPAPLGARGADRVEFLLRANAGEEPKPLARVASGGELSRIMLAIKLCLRRADEVATYVFDEVDTGIGGATAEVVGRQIRALGDHRQVLCVTHLPQIAAFAARHFRVAKYEADGRTETEVRQLDRRERPDELARMLSGANLTARARAHAAEMLAAAQRPSAATSEPADERAKPADERAKPNNKRAKPNNKSSRSARRKRRSG